jgi:hypothetical protein
MYKIARYDKTKKIELDSCVVGRTDLLDILNVVLGHDPKHRMMVKNELSDLKCDEDAIWFGVGGVLNKNYLFQYKITIDK